jgi:hypothetical protein
MIMAILEAANVVYRPGYSTVLDTEIAKLASLTAEDIANIHAPNSDANWRRISLGTVY